MIDALERGIRSFRFLSGRRKEEVVIGDAADARVAKFFFKSRVKDNRPSERRQKFPKGYVRFENGKIFDLNDETIEGEKVFIRVSQNQRDI